MSDFRAVDPGGLAALSKRLQEIADQVDAVVQRSTAARESVGLSVPGPVGTRIAEWAKYTRAKAQGFNSGRTQVVYRDVLVRETTQHVTPIYTQTTKQAITATSAPAWETFSITVGPACPPPPPPPPRVPLQAQPGLFGILARVADVMVPGVGGFIGFGGVTSWAGRTMRSGSTAAQRSQAARWMSSLGKSPTLTAAGQLGRALAPFARVVPGVGGALILGGNLGEGQSRDRALVESATEVGVGVGVAALAGFVCTVVTAGACAVVIAGGVGIVAVFGDEIGEGAGWVWDEGKGVFER